ncbi:cysteine--tRNA ligase [Desulforhopalus singaporensis]|uniref:Cysteine--tRNA ligase n=1 Tax=Desulforhopalus singaporensis TaxID=91360 RepID=A0A1H0JLE0_9BACT|nr:cysteine--tRNA ligase [Desulforhopalus singaporensis]SDO44382.1 cysteinyl-tRNA synthetase [Desulforhopalus singaporensis]
MLHQNVCSAIGNTPLVRINRLGGKESVEIYGKIEATNPGGSVKERISLSMIEAGEASGELTRDKIVLEATSGNTGIGLAMVCAAKGYRCVLVMPESASIERRKIMQAYGAEILLTPAARATDGAIEKSYAMVREFPDRYFLTDQYNNEANWRAHYNQTAPEIWKQTGGKVTHLVATLGTSGTIMGLCAWFHEFQPHVKVIAVEPHLDHKIQGLKNMKESYKPGIFDKSVPDQIVQVDDEDAFETARKLAAKEGILVGMSSGGAMAAAIDYSRDLDKGMIVVILPDGGERYLSTPLFTPPKKNDGKKNQLRFYNSLSKKKEEFVPQIEGRVSFYSCGPTAYEFANLALCRRFIVSDLITRTLESKGFQVDAFMNFTDLDDNTIAGAEAAQKPLKEFTRHYIDSFLQDMETLGVKKATGYPKASESVGHMIEIAHELLHKGYAYEKHGSIYFDISKSKKYGRLSGIDLSKIQLGKTVDLDDYEKDNPRDFTLLKRSTLQELKKGIFYETDWGNVRPSWHVECSAMALQYLGTTMDIHTSSRNLIFPHHENEIAVAEALTGKQLANYWLHSELVLVNGKHMSSDAGNNITLKELVEKGYTAREVRFMLLSVHYRKPLDFSYKRLDSVRTALRRLDEFTCKLNCLPGGRPHPEVAAFVSGMEEQFYEAMNDDLNVSKGMGAIYNFIRRLNPILQVNHLDKDQKNYILESLKKLDRILNVFRLQGCPLAPDVNALIQKREQARLDKDWALADRVREELVQKGITVIDTENGPVWKRAQDMD